MNGVKLALATEGRRRLLNNAQKMGRSGEPWCIHRRLALFSISARFGELWLERGMMTLHKAVGVSCNKDATTANQSPGT